MRIVEIVSENSESLEENLKKWFQDKWVRFGPDGKIRGACARGSESEGKPKCLPQSKAHSLGKKGRASAAARKRRQDPNPERKGKAKNVATKRKTNEASESQVIGPYKLISVQGNQVQVQGRDDLTLAHAPKEPMTPGFNYAFEVSGNQIQRVILLVVDMVIHTDNAVLMIKRKRPPFADHWALPGGFIDPGETPKQAAFRELQEETGMTVSSAQPVGVFKTPYRDPRMENTWSYAFKLHVADPAQVRAGDDASAAQWVPLNKVQALPLAFDHKNILDKALSGLSEAWSAKYKQSINCNDPKGFSQRAHCQGKKKTNEAERITEVQDDPYPFTIKNLGYKDYQAKITLPDGATLNVEIFWEDTLDSWRVRYYLDDDQDVTDGNHTFRIFATIVSVVKRFVFMKKPRSISFVAYNVDGDRDGSSAIKLYNRLVQRYANAWGYDAKISPNRAYVSYTLNKKSGAGKDPTAAISPQAQTKTSESTLEFTDIPFTQCPGCGGDIVHESQLLEKQDACYHKVKARYKVWPSAYASGALVQCRKKGAKNWGKKK